MKKPTGPCEICGGRGTVWEPSNFGRTIRKCTVCQVEDHTDYSKWIADLKQQIKG